MHSRARVGPGRVRPHPPLQTRSFPIVHRPTFDPGNCGGSPWPQAGPAPPRRPRCRVTALLRSILDRHPRAPEASMNDSATGKPSVLYVCVHNAGRSQMAAAYTRHLSGGAVEVRSAGSEPADRVNPSAVAAMGEHGIDITAERPKVLTTDAVEHSDVVITMGAATPAPSIRASATRTGPWRTPPARAWSRSAPSATRSGPASSLFSRTSESARSCPDGTCRPGAGRRDEPPGPEKPVPSRRVRRSRGCRPRPARHGPASSTSGRRSVNPGPGKRERPHRLRRAAARPASG